MPASNFEEINMILAAQTMSQQQAAHGEKAPTHPHPSPGQVGIPHDPDNQKKSQAQIAVEGTS